MSARHAEVSEAHEGQRLGRWLKRELGNVPQSLIFKIIRTGQVRVDGKRAKPDQKLKTGQDIRIPPVNISDAPKKQGLSEKDRAYIKSLVIYDDGDLVAINKPGDIATQGGTNVRRHIDGLLEGLKNKKGTVPRLVHRLDKDTSGVLLLARSAEAVRELGFMFKGRDIDKRYWALVAPTPDIHEGTIDAPMIKSGDRDRERIMINVADGQKAITDYVVVDHAAGRAAFIVFRPQTGRTHQLRVHASQVLNCPIIGDKKYHYDPETFGDEITTRRVHLHAYSLSFSHPLTKKHVFLNAPLPPDLKKSWKTFGFRDKVTEKLFEAGRLGKPIIIS